MTSKGAMKMQPKAEELRFLTKNDGAVHIHPSSVNFMVTCHTWFCSRWFRTVYVKQSGFCFSSVQVRHYDSPYLVYHEKVKTSRVFIRDCSMVCVYPMVLFGGGQVNVELQHGEFIISLDDGWIRFTAASHEVSRLILRVCVFVWYIKFPSAADTI